MGNAAQKAVDAISGTIRADAKERTLANSVKQAYSMEAPGTASAQGAVL